MKINIDGKDYTLDTKRAVDLGVLKEDKKYIITLTQEQAEVLCYVTGSIGGDPNTTPRKHTEAVYNLLCAQSVDTYSVTKNWLFKTSHFEKK